MKSINILICDDHRLFRDGVKTLLQTQDDFKVVGEAENGNEAIQLAAQLKPDVILLDINMPECNGLEAITQIIKQEPQTAILMLTVSEDSQELFEAIKCGAKGYLFKNLNMNELFQSIRTVGHGGISFSEGLAEKVLIQFSEQAQQLESKINNKSEKLTNRELDVLQCVASGLTNKNISKSLYISENTVKKHLKNINKKLQIQSRAQAVAIATSKGWI